MVDVFADYYGSLYNLKDDAFALQPYETDVQAFFTQLQLLTLSESQLKDLNSPFTPCEVKKSINHQAQMGSQWSIIKL